MFDRAIKRTLAATLVSSTLCMGGNASAFQVPVSGGFATADVEIGSCSGVAQHYEYSPGTGIGNVFALINTPDTFGYNVNPHYDGYTPGVPYSSNPSANTLTSADIESQCGMPDAVYTIIGVASGPYADEDLIGYTVVGKDPSNSNAYTVWEVAVSGVTNTQSIAKKNSVLAQADDASGAAGTPITPLDVLANDTTDGVASTTTNSVLTVTSAASNPGVVLDKATGLLTTTAAVPAGTYTITYQICNAALPTLCTQAVATVTVTGTTAPTTPTPVPTNSPWALLLAGMALAGAFLRIQAKQ